MDPTPRRHGTRAGFSIVGLVAALLIVGVTVLALTSRQPQHSQAAATPAAPVAVADVRAAFNAGLTCVKAGDLAGWQERLPAGGSAAQRVLAELYRHLAPLRWTSLGAGVTAIPGKPDTFDVKLTGSIAGVGPADRLVAERVLLVRRLDDRLTVVGDETPAGIRHEYLMAFDKPRLIEAQGGVVVYDSTWRARAEELAADLPQARARLALLGLHPRRRVVIFCFSSTAEVTDYLAQPLDQGQGKFFSDEARRLNGGAAAPADIGVVAPALAAREAWAPLMLAHELTHAFTLPWFDKTAHAPPLLEEGLAVAVEGGRSYAALRRELASGNKSMPLLEEFAVGDLFMSGGPARVRLAYLESGAVVGYIVAHWGPVPLRRFVVEVADSSLSPHDIKEAVRRRLGESWTRFYAGLVQYVYTLP
jgi:hypothetical protein